MTNAQNGARIKAWAGPNVGGGIVRNVTFDGFIESKVNNPVVIDQVCMMSIYSAVSADSACQVLHDERDCLCAISIQYIHTRHLV